MTFIERSRPGATICPPVCADGADGMRRRMQLSATCLAAPLLWMTIATGSSSAWAADAPSGFAVSTGSALLIGNGRSVSLPALPDCEPALRDLGNRLRGQGDDVTEVIDAPGPALRAAIGRFAADLPLSGQVVVAYCGYAMSDADKLFLLPADAAIAQAADLPRQAVIARTVSRILARHPSLFVAELHVSPGANAASLASGIQSLREETTPDTHLAVAVESAAAGAPLIGAFSLAVSSSKDWSAFSGEAADATTPPAVTPSSAIASPATTMRPIPVTPPPAPSPPLQIAAGSAPAVVPVPEPEYPPVPDGALEAKAGVAASDASPGTPPTAGKEAPPGPDASPTVGGSAAARTEQPATASPGSTPISLPPPRKPHARPWVLPNDGGSPIIRRIQMALVARRLMRGDITGHTDAATQAAVSTYQKSLGHPATGFLTYDEMSSLELHKRALPR